MKITSVKTHVLGDTMLVSIHTDSSLIGLGESACWAYPGAAAAVIDRFATYLVGETTNRIEHHWHRMARMAPFRGAAISGALSAVDIALWDLRGRELGVPTHALLGGPYRDRVRLHRIIQGADTESLGRAAADAAAAGYTAVKFDPLGPAAIDATTSMLAATARERAAAVQDATNGRVDLIIEIHRALTPHQVPAVLDVLRPLAPLFVEDPIQIDTIDIQARLTSHGVPLGLGERWQSPYEVREALQVGGPFVVRSDVALAGGISAAKKISAIAEAHHAQVSWHNWAGPVAAAATLTVDTAISNTLTHEHAEDGLAAFGAAAHSGWRIDDGYAIASTMPGIGIDLDLERLPERVDVLDRPLHEIPRRRDGSVAFAV